MHATRGDAAIPSLFADGSAARTSAPAPGLLAELEGHREVRRGSIADAADLLGRYPWRLVAAAFVCLALLLVLTLPGGRRAGEGVRTPAAALFPAGEPAQTRSMSPAVILDDPPPSRSVAAGGQEAHVGAPDSGPMALLREETVPVASRGARRRPVARADSDVDLLAALVQHAGHAPGPEAASASQPARLAELLAAGSGIDAAEADVDGREVVSRALAGCPPANTEAGLACRQSACTGRWGEHPSCPRPTAPPMPTGG